MAHAGGRPPKYKSAKEMQKVIDKYFEDCKGEVLKDDNGEIVYDKYGKPVIVNQRPPTVTGLALALGFNTRLALLNYQGKPEFMNTITRAKSRIEAYAEERLFDKDGVNGAKFSLANNFKEWKEKSEVDNNIGNKDNKPFEIKQTYDLSKLTLEEKRKLLELVEKVGGNEPTG